ncbi:MAG: squalene/phytoene synthase family protein [Acidobacteriota bacterium]|nr:squalene/phytoene synthase family protein [Acidobacteriota bacterium]
MGETSGNAGAPGRKDTTEAMGGVHALLRRVSRSFYLTLRVLPGAVRPQLGLAYLLARATDTVADTDAVAVARRREVLDAFRRSIQGAARGAPPAPPDFSEFLRTRGAGLSEKDEAELALLEEFGTLLDALGGFPDDDREEIRAVLETITQGQQLDLQRFGSGGPPAGAPPAALATDAELDDYTYKVAGCVGEFWTRLCLAHVFPQMERDRDRLLDDAVRFGKGLQLVNILRDLPEDLRRGRCYIPSQALAAHGLAPGDLLRRDASARFRPLYHGYLDLAEGHLRAGWRYTASLPPGCVRIRLACAWPVLIGVRTLRLLRDGDVLGGGRVKIARADVRRLIARSVLLYPSRKAWRRLFDA